MGRYLQNPDVQLINARPINGSFTFKGLVKQLQPGEVLVGAYYNGAYYLYPILESERQFMDHESTAIESRFYAIKESDV